MMECLLKPSKLEVLPDEPEAMKVYNCWLKTFDNFVTAVLTATDETERNNLSKIGLLTSFLSHRTFELIADATEYDQARAML